jgi:hypothetical protein
MREHAPAMRARCGNRSRVVGGRVREGPELERSSLGFLSPGDEGCAGYVHDYRGVGCRLGRWRRSRPREQHAPVARPSRGGEGYIKHAAAFGYWFLMSRDPARNPAGSASPRVAHPRMSPGRFKGRVLRGGPATRTGFGSRLGRSTAVAAARIGFGSRLGGSTGGAAALPPGREAYESVSRSGAPRGCNSRTAGGAERRLHEKEAAR